MKIHKAQISIYALEYRGDRGDVIREFWRILKEHGISFKSTALSTLAWGEMDRLLGALEDAYRRLHQYGIIMDVKITPIGPPPDYEIRDDEVNL